MQTIYKYQITNLNGVTLHVPYCGDLTFDKQVLHCDVQNDVPCLWVMVDSEEEARPVRVIVLGTGHSADKVIENGLKHVGSFMLIGGAFVGHVFAENKYPERR